MKELKYILTLAFLTLLFACSYNVKNSGTATNDKSIFQNSFQHGDGISDSIVLAKTDTSDNGFYGKILIFRKKKLVFEYTEKDLEITGMSYSIFVEQEILFHKEYFYIFKLPGAPSPDNYLVIKTTPDTTFLFGITEPNSAEIFGDIDNDGKFEIGGWSDWCEEDETHKCPDLSLYKVFEIDSGFLTDTTLTNYFRHFMKK
ncbi:MAG: hypothetical protein ABI723_05675 [Bacteroidia bacterium]